MINELATIKERVEKINADLVSLCHKSMLDATATDIGEINELKNLILKLQSQIGILQLRVTPRVHVTEETNDFFSQEKFVLFSSKIKIGQLAQAMFPFIFSHQMITDDILTFLCSQASSKYFKGRPDCTILRLYTGNDKDFYDFKGRRRYYANIYLHYSGKTYILTKELWSKGLKNMVKFFYQLGLNMDAILAICSGDEQSAMRLLRAKKHLIDIKSRRPPKRTAIHRSEEKNDIDDDMITRFPYTVGSLAKIIFPILCEREMLSEYDVEYLQTIEARQRLKAGGSFILKPTSVPEEELWSSGNRRYYTDLTLAVNNSSFYLTNQFHPDGTRPLLEYILGLGMTIEEVLLLCKNNNAKLKKSANTTDSLTKDYFPEFAKNESNNSNKIEVEHDTITISDTNKMHTAYFKDKH